MANSITTDEFLNLICYNEYNTLCPEYNLSEIATKDKTQIDAERTTIQNGTSFNFENQINLQSAQVSADLTNIPSDLLTFDTKTKFPQPEKLPKDFSPAHFLEQGKNAGLGIANLHKRGITGKGINIAIIDYGLADHEEYHGKIKKYYEWGLKEKPATQQSKGSFHGAAVTSLCVGNTCGIAPDAQVYYFASAFTMQKNQGQRIIALAALNKIIELNHTLPKEERISAVSISTYFDDTILGSKEFEQARLQLEKEGTPVITCSNYKQHGMSMNGFNRDMNKDINDPNNATPITSLIDRRMSPDWISPDKHKTLLFPCDHRTFAINTGPSEYMHSARGGFSWLPPTITGLYALAKQVQPEITLEHFWKTGLNTGYLSQDMNGIIVQPEKLISSLEQEKIITTHLIKNNPNNHK